jgi:hypothetical protein
VARVELFERSEALHTALGEAMARCMEALHRNSALPA